MKRARKWIVSRTQLQKPPEFSWFDTRKSEDRPESAAVQLLVVGNDDLREGL